MRAYFSIIILSLFLFISCGTSKQFISNKIEIPTDFAGMVHAGHTKTPAEYHFIDEMGISWVLTTFYWGSIEHKEGVWDFASTDAFVDSARSYSKKIIAVLGYQTDWIYPQGGSKKYISPAHIPDFVNFVEKTVSRYKGKIDAWQIWNEPNFKMFWKGSKEDYLALTAAASAKIQQIDPQAKVLMGGFNLLGYGKYLQSLFNSNLMTSGRAASFHPYNATPLWSAGIFDNFAKRLNKNHFQGEIFVTEVGYPTGGWYPSKVGDKKLGAYIVKTLTLLAIRGVRVACWYQLFDPDPQKRNKSNSEDYFGLAFHNYTYKQGAKAYPACVKNIAGKTYIPQYQAFTNIPKSVSTFYFEGNDGTKTLILWKKSAGTKKISLPSTVKNATLFDAKTEITRPVEENEILKVTPFPFIITWK
ncbi:MAG: hypothetical protein LBR36_01275 [Bacteroidales bacterium]|jgi:hypothetical protein|nr:hypothetical protein [Bacteroidales bacterium]